LSRKLTLISIGNVVNSIQNDVAKVPERYASTQYIKSCWS